MALSVNKPQSWAARAESQSVSRNSRNSAVLRPCARCCCVFLNFEQGCDHDWLKDSCTSFCSCLTTCRNRRSSIEPLLLQDAPAGSPLKLFTQHNADSRRFSRSCLLRSLVQSLCSKVMLVTLVFTHTRTMLRRLGALYVCGQWLRPAATFPLWWGDVFSLSNRSGKNVKPFLLQSVIKNHNTCFHFFGQFRILWRLFFIWHHEMG